MISHDIAVDIDGTICMHAYPEMGADIGAAPVLRRLVNAGHRLIINTMRSGSQLEDAVAWFRKNQLPVYGIQRHPTQHKWTNSTKCYAHLYLDDAALGAPLVLVPNGRPYFDWKKAEKMFERMGWI